MLLYGKLLVLSILCIDAISSTGTPYNSTYIPKHICYNYFQPGDILLGGIFPLMYTEHEGSPCTTNRISNWGVASTEALVFAVDEINRQSDLLPNITLGFDLRDGCRNEDVALFHATTLASFTGREEYEKVCGYHPTPNHEGVTAIIGTGRSATCVFAAKVANIYNIPLISHWSATDELSNKDRFPYFLRVVPADKEQIGGIVDILHRFNWRYVGVLYSQDADGLLATQYFKKLAEPAICIAFSQSVALTSDLDKVVDIMADFDKASAIVMFTSYDINLKLMDRFQASRLPNNKTFICTTYCGFGWTSEPRAERAFGSFFLRYNTISVPEYNEHIKQLKQLNLTEIRSPFVAKYIEIQNKPLAVTSYAIFVINAVYAFAHGMHSYIENKCSGNWSSCMINKKNLLDEIKNVSFQALDGPFEFDDEGNGREGYKIENVQRENGTYVVKTIGYWDPRRSEGQRLTVDGDENLQFAGNAYHQSLCKDECKPGSIEVPLNRKCCWGCQPCRPEEIVVDRTKCVACESIFEWPSDDRDQCMPIIPTSVSWKEPTIVFIITFTVLGLILSCLVLFGFFYERHHPLIKATSRELSAINLTGLVITLLAIFCLLLKPTSVSCVLSETALVLSFTVTFSPTLLKVNRIYRIFKAGRKSTKRPMWVGKKHQVIMCSILIAIQIGISLISIVVNPASPAVIVPRPRTPHLEEYCRFSPVFMASCTYNLLIIASCCIFAFFARKVPSNYNESKFIAITVYSTMIAWLAAVPVYSTAVMVVQIKATLCVALLVNAYLILSFLYIPKFYAIMYVSDGLQIEDQSTRSKRLTFGTHATIADQSMGVWSGSAASSNSSSNRNHAAQSPPLPRELPSDVIKKSQNNFTT